MQQYTKSRKCQMLFYYLQRLYYAFHAASVVGAFRLFTFSTGHLVAGCANVITPSYRILRYDRHYYLPVIILKVVTEVLKTGHNGECTHCRSGPLQIKQILIPHQRVCI